MAIFDKEASNYDSWYTSELGSFVDMVETDCALSLFNFKPGAKILDIGCGTGNLSIKLAKAKADVVGIDISNEMLSVAKRKSTMLGYDIEYKNMNVYDIQYEENYFDGAFCFAAFEFIDEPLKALNEIFRVVKKGSPILIGTINADSKWGDLYAKLHTDPNSVFKHAHLKTSLDLANLKPNELVAIKECLFIPPNTAPEDINLNKEIELSSTEKGGFLCALWNK